MSKAKRIINLFYRFFSWIGEGVLRCQSRAFYVLIIILCFLAPLFAIIMVITLLCGVYRRCSPEL